MTAGAIDTPDGLVPGYFMEDGRFKDLDDGVWEPAGDGTWIPPSQWLELDD